jgi:hypothetical protein
MRLSQRLRSDVRSPIHYYQPLAGNCRVTPLASFSKYSDLIEISAGICLSNPNNYLDHKNRFVRFLCLRKALLRLALKTAFTMGA